MTSFDITERWSTPFHLKPKVNGAKARLFGRHALNSTSVSSVSAGPRHTDHQERTSNPLVDTPLLRLELDATTLLPDASSIELTWLQAALDGQPTWLASTILENINWSARQPGEIALGVRLALVLQDPIIGRAIAAQGHNLYPSDTELAKLHRVLAPPTTTTLRAATRPDTHSNLNWLTSNQEAYHGQWVALDDGRLLATAGSIGDLIAQVGDVRHTNILITQVW